MTTIHLDISMSLDGAITGPDAAAAMRSGAGSTQAGGRQPYQNSGKPCSRTISGPLRGEGAMSATEDLRALQQGMGNRDHRRGISLRSRQPLVRSASRSAPCSG
jgi:hypothetical protein